MNAVLRLSSTLDTIEACGSTYSSSEHNGYINISLSEEHCFDALVGETERELRELYVELQKHQEVELLCLDIGYEARDVAVEVNRIPVSLLELLVEMAIPLGLSRYPSGR